MNTVRHCGLLPGDVYGEAGQHSGWGGGVGAEGLEPHCQGSHPHTVTLHSWLLNFFVPQFPHL